MTALEKVPSSLVYGANLIGDMVFGRFEGFWGFIWGLVLIIGLPGAIVLAVTYVLRSR